jgi:hypothetical protein
MMVFRTGLTSVMHCRYFTEGVVDPIAVVAGLVQTGLYLDFFYVYFTKCVSNFIFRAPCSPRVHTFVSVPLHDHMYSYRCRVLQGQKFELPA